MDTTGRRKFFSRCVCCDADASRGEGLSRRNFLAGSAATLDWACRRRDAGSLSAGAGAAKPAGSTSTTTSFRRCTPQAPARHRMRPPKWSAGTVARGHGQEPGSPPRSLDLSNPGVWFGKADEESRKLARDCNEYARQDRKRRPGSFAHSAAGHRGACANRSPGRLKAEGSRCINYRNISATASARAQPAQGGGLHPSDRIDLLRRHDQGRPEGRRDGTETTRTIASLMFGEGGTARVSRTSASLVAQRRHVPFLISRFAQQTSAKPDRACRTARYRPAEVLLRGGAGQHAGPARGAAQDGPQRR